MDGGGELLKIEGECLWMEQQEEEAQEEEAGEAGQEGEEEIVLPSLPDPVPALQHVHVPVLLHVHVPVPVPVHLSRGCDEDFFPRMTNADSTLSMHTLSLPLLKRRAGISQKRF